MTRPASSLPPASYAHCWAGTWSSLLTGWLGFGQVGLEPLGSHPLGNNNPFHGVISNPKVSGLPWREQALVRRRVCCSAALHLHNLGHTLCDKLENGGLNNAGRLSLFPDYLLQAFNGFWGK